MQVLITEQSHNRVVWAVKSNIVWIELGLLVGWGGFAALALIAPSSLHWPLIIGVGVVVAAVAILLAVTMPMTTRGDMERTPTGGDIRYFKRWFPLNERKVWIAPLEDVNGFRVEARDFEETDGSVYALARVWATLDDAKPVTLTPWVEPASAQTLAETLAKAGRRPLAP